MVKTVTCTISQGGNITAEVTGVSGPSCEGDLKWLDKLGMVVESGPTIDFEKTPDLDNDNRMTQDQ